MNQTCPICKTELPPYSDVLVDHLWDTHSIAHNIGYAMVQATGRAAAYRESIALAKAAEADFAKRTGTRSTPAEDQDTPQELVPIVAKAMGLVASIKKEKLHDDRRWAFTYASIVRELEEAIEAVYPGAVDNLRRARSAQWKEG